MRIVDVMADLADSTNSVLTPSDTRILYEQISEGAAVRRLVLDLFAFKKTDKLLAEHEDAWHARFLRAYSRIGIAGLTLRYHNPPSPGLRNFASSTRPSPSEVRIIGYVGLL